MNAVNEMADEYAFIACRPRRCACVTSSDCWSRPRSTRRPATAPRCAGSASRWPGSGTSWPWTRRRLPRRSAPTGPDRGRACRAASELADTDEAHTAPSFRADARSRPPLCGFPEGEGQQHAGRGSVAADESSSCHPPWPPPAPGVGPELTYRKPPKLARWSQQSSVCGARSHPRSHADVRHRRMT